VKNWCNTLLTAPLEPACWCAPAPGVPARQSRRAKCCVGEHPIRKWGYDAQGNATFNAQYGQDWWLYTNLIENGYLPRSGGTYVDLATNDAIFRSSTYFFDACLGWKGACIEADPRHYYGIFKQRTCTLVPACASDKQQRMNFTVDTNEQSGGSSTLGPKRLSGTKQKRLLANANLAKQVHCDTLTSMLEQTSMNHVNLLSLDVEGHEEQVLSGIDFSRISFDVVLIEPTCRKSPQSCHILSNAGYTQLRGQNVVDSVWLHSRLAHVKHTAARAFQCRNLKRWCRGWDFNALASVEGSGVQCRALRSP
jgi:FkbM family methyltransferase